MAPGATAARPANSRRFFAGPVVGQSASIKASIRIDWRGEREMPDARRPEFALAVGFWLLDKLRFLDG